ncbi:uncharacterized protein EV422DRAFT_536374, partial [Fimicolochytrium jonesii]|uniref:uncharacterized protein n=1 Tax=Fimicolochytrium jonesii TaxID=1396493 RepID=UPI0022FF1087
MLALTLRWELIQKLRVVSGGPVFSFSLLYAGTVDSTKIFGKSEQKSRSRKRSNDVAASPHVFVPCRPVRSTVPHILFERDLVPDHPDICTWVRRRRLCRFQSVILASFSF